MPRLLSRLQIEVEIPCYLTARQRRMYEGVKAKISAADLLGKSTMSDDNVNTLMNLIAQFRKVCNHPELFERRDITSPLQWFDPVWAQMAAGAGPGVGVDPVPVSANCHNPIALPLPRVLHEPLGALQAWDAAGPTGADRWRLLHTDLSLCTAAALHDAAAPLGAAARLLGVTPAEAHELATTADGLRRWLLELHLQDRLRVARARALLAAAAEPEVDAVAAPAALAALLQPARAGRIVDVGAPTGAAAQAEAAATPAAALSPMQELLQVWRSPALQQEAMLAEHVVACVLPTVMAEPVRVVSSSPSAMWAQEDALRDVPHKAVLLGVPLPSNGARTPAFGFGWAPAQPWRSQVTAPPPPVLPPLPGLPAQSLPRPLPCGIAHEAFGRRGYSAVAVPGTHR